MSKRTTISLADINPKCLERNMEALRPPERRAKREEAAQMARDIIKVKRPHQMTRTEREFEAILKQEFYGCPILFERYTLKLGNDCRYTPDFAVIHYPAPIHFYEVKGAFLFIGASKTATHTSLTKPKLAAEIFPWHRFFRATKAKDGTWSREEYLPA